MRYVGVFNEAGDIATLAKTATTQVRYVSKSGSATGDGSNARPFDTITNAMNSITDASVTKRYVIQIAPGNYTETTLNLKPNVFLVGDHYMTVRITTTTLQLDSTWNAVSTVDNRSGAIQVSFLNAANFDFSTVTSSAGKLYFEDCSFASTLTVKSYNSINQALFDGCYFYGATTMTGTTCFFTSSVFFNNIAINAATTAGTWQHQFLFSRIQGNVTINGTGNTSSKQTHTWFLSTNISGTLTATGDYTYVNLTSDSTPENFDKATHITGGAQVYFKNKVPYAPAYDGWYYSTRGSSVPSSTTDGLDNLSAEAFNSWWSDNTDSVRDLRAYAIHEAQIGTTKYNKVYYDNLSDNTGFTITGTATYTYNTFIQGGTGTSYVTTNAITIDAASTSFILYPIATNGEAVYEYSLNGTTWTACSAGVMATYTAGSTTLYVRVALDQNEFFWGWAILYNNQ